MHVLATLVDESSVDALVARFEMQAIFDPPENDWRSTCSFDGWWFLQQKSFAHRMLQGWFGFCVRSSRLDDAHIQRAYVGL